MKIVLLFLAWSCATHVVVPPPQVSESQRAFPEWVADVAKGCQELTQLCASGQGASKLEAKQQAELNLLTIFDVPAMPRPSSFEWEKEVGQEALKQANKITKKFLPEIKLEQEAVKDKIFHALVSLDKKLIEDTYRSEIQKNRNLLHGTWDKRSRNNVKKLVRLAVKQEALLSRFALVSTEKLSDDGPSFYEKTYSWFSSLPPEKISLKAGKAPVWMLEKITKILKDSGYSVVSHYPSKMLILQVDSIRENHEENNDRFTFTVTLSASMNNESQVRVVESSFARSQSEALIKARPALENSIERHFSKLHLE